MVPVRASAAAAETRKVGREDGRGRVAGDDGGVGDAAGGAAAGVRASELGSEMLLVDCGSGLTVTDRIEVVMEGVWGAKSLDAKVVVAVEGAEAVVVVSGVEVSGKLIERGSSAADG